MNTKAGPQGSYYLNLKSDNGKTGPIGVSTSTSATCPDACPLKRTPAASGGCYADSGPLGMHWAKVSAGTRGDDWATFLAKVRTISPGALWRHNQAGDLPGIGDKLDTAALRQLVAANAGRRGFTYTHKPMHTAAARKAIADANKRGFTINLSANSLAHADELADLAIAPVAVVLPSDQTANCQTPTGRKVIVCPATIRDDVSCATCQMCQRQRDVIIGFPAHGASKRKASTVAVTFHRRAA